MSPAHPIRALSISFSVLLSALAINLTIQHSTAFAVHDEAFELEGNTTDDSLADPPVDWTDLFDANFPNTPTPKAVLPNGFGSALFIRDFVPGKSGPDPSTFTTGSKDVLNISGGWDCSKSNNVTDKIDIVNAYATAAVINGDVILYFAMERFSNEGDANVGFWFLQDPSVGCNPIGKTGQFTGDHVDGDLLVVSEFTNGGVVSSIMVYRWDGGPGGSLNPVAIVSGGDCKTLMPGDPDSVCATVNDSPFTPPWLTETKQSGPNPSNDLGVSEFFEGALNLTENNLVACFSHFLAVTRSSQSLTATLFDYTLGDFELCSIDVQTSCAASTTESLNPIVDPADGESVLTRFEVTINNDGAAPVYDVTLSEDIALEAGESCQILAIDTFDVAIPIESLPVSIANELLGGDTVTLEIQCDSNDNPLMNKVTATAGTATGLADLSDTDMMETSEACSLVSNPALAVTKTCEDVSLLIDGGYLTVVVSVRIEIENTGDEKLINVVVTDDMVSGLDHIDSNGNLLAPFDGELLPGEKAYFAASYIPADTDNSEGDPGLATFTDRVEVEAEGALSGQPLDPKPFAAATCSLCP